MEKLNKHLRGGKMTRYEELKEEKENFIRAAKKASDKNMVALWKHRADETQEKIDSLTVAEAEKEI